jgi:hypothetical protein
LEDGKNVYMEVPEGFDKYYNPFADSIQSEAIGNGGMLGQAFAFVLQHAI